MTFNRLFGNVPQFKYLAMAVTDQNKKHRLRVFENRVLSRILRLKRDEVTNGWRNCITRSFVTCI
jgi:hypothetical protein